MAITYQGRQYREDGAPLDATGNVQMGGSWINPNYAYDGGILTDSQNTRFDLGSITAQGGMQIRPDVTAGIVPPPAPPTPWGGAAGAMGAQAGSNLQTMPMNGGPVGGATGYAPQGQIGNTMPAGTSGGGAWGGAGTTNPYLSNMADEIGRRSQQGLGQAFNQIRSNAVGVGGLGGSRQGVAQGVATGQAMDSLQGNLSTLFGGQYNQDAGRELSRYQGDQGFYNAQRTLDQSGAQLGANLYQQGQQGMWGPLNNANNIYGTYTGLGNTTNSQESGGGWQGALGGALGAAQLYTNLNRPASGGSSTPSTGWW